METNNKEKQISGNRWKAAQRYEAEWWRSYQEDFQTSNLEKLAKLITNKINTYQRIDNNTSIIEVGPGPIGIVAFMKGGTKVGIDPLHDTYEKIESYSKLRQSAIKNGTLYIHGKGENIPYDDNSFDICISDNVLDHVDSHKEFISEIHRILTKGGIAYIRVHVYHGWGRLLRYLMELFTIDKGHPYTFSTASVKNLAQTNGFQVLSTERTSFWDGWKKDCKRALSGNLKALVQVLFLITRADYEIIVKKT